MSQTSEQHARSRVINLSDRLAAVRSASVDLAASFVEEAHAYRREAREILVGHAGTPTAAEKQRAAVLIGKAQGLEFAADRLVAAHLGSA